MKLKMCTTSKIFGKKAIRDTFFQYVVFNQGRNGKGETSIFWWGVTSNRRVWFKILGMSRKSPVLIPHKKYLEECAWSEYCNNFETSVWNSIFYFKATNIQHKRLEIEMEKRWQNLWWCSIYERLSIHFIIKSI